MSRAVQPSCRDVSVARLARSGRIKQKLHSRAVRQLTLLSTWQLHIACRIDRHAVTCLRGGLKIFHNPIRHLCSYILESNPQSLYSFRGLKNQMRIRIACGLDSRSWAGFLKNDRAAVRAVRTIQYNNLLFYLLFIMLYNIYNLLLIRLAVFTHNWISLPCRQGAVEGKVRIRTAN